MPDAPWTHDGGAGHLRRGRRGSRGRRSVILNVRADVVSGSDELRIGVSSRPDIGQRDAVRAEPAGGPEPDSADRVLQVGIEHRVHDATQHDRDAERHEHARVCVGLSFGITSSETVAEDEPQRNEPGSEEGTPRVRRSSTASCPRSAVPCLPAARRGPRRRASSARSRARRTRRGHSWSCRSGWTSTARRRALTGSGLEFRTTTERTREVQRSSPSARAPLSLRRVRLEGTAREERTSTSARSNATTAPMSMAPRTFSQTNAMASTTITPSMPPRLPATEMKSPTRAVHRSNGRTTGLRVHRRVPRPWKSTRYTTKNPS